MSAADEAKNAAWRAAQAIAQHRRNLAAETMRAAEIQVLRTALAATLPGGEVEYWERVERKLRE